MIVAEPLLPSRPERRHPFPNARPDGKLNNVTLAVVKADGFNVLKALKRPSKTDGGILTTGEQDQGLPDAVHGINPIPATMTNRQCVRPGALAKRSLSSRRLTA